MNKERYNWLRWKILEYKCMYYMPELVHESRHKELIISDTVYDGLEAEMLSLDKQLGYNKGKILDFPQDTPSGQLVKDKLSSELRRT